MADVDNQADIIDSRDIIERINELTRDAEDHLASEDDLVELEILTKLAEDAEGYSSDWRYGEALIRDSYFEDYAQEVAEELGMISGAEKNCIDWERAAKELQYDYTSVDFDGVTYWLRCS
jgi:hypothetical protein